MEWPKVDMDFVIKVIVALIIIILIILLLLYLYRWYLVTRYKELFDLETMDGVEGFEGTFTSVWNDISFLKEKIIEKEATS